MNEQDALHNSTTPPHLQPSVLVAVATLVLASSAVFWKSNLRLGNLRTLPNAIRSEQATTLDDEHETHDVGEGSTLNDSSKATASRSKERRKRRKDPMKELIKGGKRGKDLAKLLKHVDLPGSNESSSALNSASNSATMSVTSEQSNRNRSGSRSESGARGLSASRSSRSVSMSSVAEVSARGALFGEDDEEQEITPTEIPPSPVVPETSHSPSTSYDSTPSLVFSLNSAGTADTSIQSVDLDPALDEAPKSISNIRRNKNSNSKNSTPHNSSFDNLNQAPSQSTASVSTALYTRQKDSDSSSSTLTTIPSSSGSLSSPRVSQPPRFRSQTRPEPRASLGSPSMPIYSTFHSTGSVPDFDSGHSVHTDAELIGNESHSTSSPSFNFPTLNAASVPGSSKASSSPAPGTPSGSTSSSGLTTQTQIASLRGALEASRQREEEAKGREERMRSELEKLENMLRWEGSLWRRREGELQTQIHHLVQQIQCYAAYFPPLQSPQAFPLQNLAVPQPQRSLGKNSHAKGKRPHTQSQASPTSSRSTSKSSRPSHSSHASPIPPLTQLPEGQSTSRGSSSPSVGSPLVPPSRMFSPAAPFSPGISSTPYGIGPFSPSFAMFSPTGLPTGGMPFASPPAGMTSPLSPYPPYLPYHPYTTFGSVPPASQSNASGTSLDGAKMHPMQFLNMLNNAGNGTGANGTETGGMSTSSTMSSLASGTESADSTSPEFTTSPSPSPGAARERGRKRGRGGAAGTGDRMAPGYAPEYSQYGYPYGYPYSPPTPNSYQPYPGASPLQAESGKEDKEGLGDVVENDKNNAYDSNDDEDDDGTGQVNELLADAILKRPESMMGLRRSGSGSGRSSKSNIRNKEKLQLSPTELGFGLGDSPQAGDDTVILSSPGSDSAGLGLGLGLDWVKDPGLFRRESDELSSYRNQQALASLSMPPESKLPSTESTDSNTSDLTNENDSSSSSSSQSASTGSSESLAETPPVEFTFPSIATWGYSYRTHSAGNFEETKNIEPLSSQSLVEVSSTDDVRMEEESTPPADALSKSIDGMTVSIALDDDPHIPNDH